MSNPNQGRKSQELEFEELRDFVCSICLDTIIGQHGCFAFPVNDGLWCCNECEEQIVIPMRLRQSKPQPHWPD